MAARTLVWLGIAVALASSGVPSLSAQGAQATRSSDRQQEKPAPPPQVFGSDLAFVLNFIKPDRTAEFEAVVARMKEALQKSERPERKQQAIGWRVFKAAEPGPAGSVIYVFVVDSPLKGANYSVTALLRDAFPTEADTLEQEFGDSLVQAQVVMNFTLKSVLRK